MRILDRNDLMSLETYAEQREAFRQRVIEHKRDRRLPIGPNLALYFEDRLTIHYQVQEMLRIERIFEADAIQEELDAYNPLIPDGRNWKATGMLEYPDPEERRRQLAQLRGIEDHIWVCVEGHERSFAIANEDIERSNDEKTSAVHFMRFELDEDMIRDLRGGAMLTAGVEHDLYRHATEVPGPVRESLLSDLEGGS